MVIALGEQAACGFGQEASRPSLADREARRRILPTPRENVLIQLADMVPGALRRHAEGEKDDGPLYRNAIARRLEDVWDFTRGSGPA